MTTTRIEPIGAPETEEEIKLEEIERAIIRGQQAIRERETLLVDLNGRGVTKAHLKRRLNRVRAEEGAPQLTFDAVAKAISRASR